MTALTSNEHDAETGLDYFGARYFSGAQGRFTTPDQPFADQHSDDPQSWNLYSYARNNPLRFIDVQGRAVFESAAKLMQAGKDVMGRSSLQPVPKADSNGNPVLDSRGRQRYDTFCNFGVQQILEAGDDRTLDGMTAAKMTKYLGNTENATALSFEDAVGYAKDGATVVFAEPGHVVVVAPADMERPGNSWRTATGEQQVPVVFNVGKENKLMRLDQAWRPDQGKNARPFILNTDKRKVDELRKQRKSDDEETSR
jgi:RHS repeat-associated protein